MAQLKSIVDKLLTQASSMIVPYGYVSESILPPINVVQKTGKLALYGTNHLRIETTVSGGRGQYKRVDSVTRSTSSYSVVSNGLEDIVTPDDMVNVEAPYDAELDVVVGLTNLLWLKKEKGLADSLTSTSTITQNTTLVTANQFNDYLASDPISKFNTARSTVRTGCGFPANGAVMDWAVWNTLRFHPQMLDALGFKQNRPGGLQEDEMAKALGVEKIYIAKAVYESAAEGQTSSIAPVWGKHIVFFFCPDTAMRYQTGLGYRVQLSGSRATPRRVYKFPVYNPPESTGVIVDDHFQHFISNAACAYLIKNAIA